MKLNARGQVIIPEELQRRCGLEPGTEIGFVAVPDGILICRKEDAASLRRRMKTPPATDSRQIHRQTRSD
jgi:bifunctional DNA-binding transcriptional regulator/antitoxin component of YhaV-PrlF toxin-antitoxin module